MAADQQGVVLASQLKEKGVTRAALRHAVESGRLVELFGGAFRLSGTRDDFSQRAFAALLVAGPESAVSHQSAASVFRLPGVERTPIHLSLGNRSNLKVPIDFVVHRPTRHFETNNVDGLRVTALARTIVDCAGNLRGEPLELLLDDAHHRFADVGDRLTNELRGTRLTAIPGGFELMRLLALRQGFASESPEELRLWRLFRESSLPPYHLQHKVLDLDGRSVMTVDFAFLLHKIAVHFDGYRWHARRVTFDKDAAQRSRLAALGWHNFIVTTATLESGQCIEDLKQLLVVREPQTRFAL